MIKVIKDLLLKYLCMALPYGVKCHFKYGSAEDDITLSCIDNNVARFEYGRYRSFHVSIDADYIKPYLRPMSSMTEKEAKEISSMCLLDLRNILSIKIKDGYLDITIDDDFSSIESITLWYDELISSIECLYWLLEHHFDFMGLISKGLAIEVTNKNNPYEN